MSSTSRLTAQPSTAMNFTQQSSTPFAETDTTVENDLATSHALTQERLNVELTRLQQSDAQFLAQTFGIPLPQLNTVAIAELLINDKQFIEAPFPLYLVEALIYESKSISYPPILGPAILFSPIIKTNGDYKINFLLNGDLFTIDGNLLPNTEINVNHLFELIYAVSKELFIKREVKVESLNKVLEDQPLHVTNCQRVVISDYRGRPKNEESIATLIKIGQKV